MPYLPVVLLGYIFNSTSTLISKFIVDVNVPNPYVYTFYVSVLGLIVIVLAPFGFTLPTPEVFLISAFCALAFILALLMFYSSLYFDETSVVAPVVGTCNAIFTLLISILLFDEAVLQSHLLAVFLLVLGLIFLVSTHLLEFKYKPKHLLLMVGAGLFYAISAVLMRAVFLQTNFISGLILVYVITGCISLLFLTVPQLRKQILSSVVNKNHLINKTSRLLILGELLGAGGGFLITFGYSLTSAAIINSMQGVQYIFILAVAMLLPKHLKHLLGEDFIYKGIVLKVIGSALIVIGLGFLAFK